MEPDPLVQFGRWYDDAIAAGAPMPEAMALATATTDGSPSVRMVLLKGHDEHGFVFFTNYNSSKAAELASNPRAALVWHWMFPGRPNRQVRATGSVTAIAPADSDDYFSSRPRASQLAAWASDQSQVLTSRAVLEQRMAEAISRYADGEVPRPTWWGGYRLEPAVIEFWHHRDDRLHDRLRYARHADDVWRIERLAP